MSVFMTKIPARFRYNYCHYSRERYAGAGSCAPNKRQEFSDLFWLLSHFFLKIPFSSGFFSLVKDKRFFVETGAYDEYFRPVLGNPCNCLARVRPGTASHRPPSGIKNPHHAGIFVGGSPHEAVYQAHGLAPYLMTTQTRFILEPLFFS